MTKPHWKVVGHWSLSEAFQDVLLCETLWKSLSARLAPGAQESNQAVSPCELSKCPWMSSGKLAMPTHRLPWLRGGGIALWPADPLSHQPPLNSCHRCYPQITFCNPNSDSASGDCKPASLVTTSKWWLSMLVTSLVRFIFWRSLLESSHVASSQAMMPAPATSKLLFHLSSSSSQIKPKVTPWLPTRMFPITYNFASSIFQPLASLLVTLPRAGLREASKSITFTPIYVFTCMSHSAQNAVGPSPKFSISSYGTRH